MYCSGTYGRNGPECGARFCEIVKILYANGISRRAGLCSAQGSSVHRAIAPEETLDPIAGAGTISQISWIRKILEIATELKTAHFQFTILWYISFSRMTTDLFYLRCHVPVSEHPDRWRCFLRRKYGSSTTCMRKVSPLDEVHL